MRIEYASMDMRATVCSPEEIRKDLEAEWVKQGKRTVTTRAARPVQGPKPRAAQAPPLRGVQFISSTEAQLDLKRKRLDLLSLS